MKKINQFLFFLLIISSVSAKAQLGGTSAYSFLNLPISARVVSLGGNLMCVKDNDLNVSLVNPSLLCDSMDNNVALSFSSYFAKVKYGYVAYAKHFRKFGNMSAGIQYLDYGKLTYADDLGNTYGDFGASDMSLNISYARPILDSNFTIGATLKTIYSHLENYNSIGSALDVGATYYNPRRQLTIAAVVKNYGREWKPYVDGNRESLPFEMQIGFSKKPKHVPLRLSFIYENLQKWDLTYDSPVYPTTTVDPVTGEAITPNKYKVFGDKLMRHIVIGGEFIISKNIFIRLGYNYERRKELNIPEKRALDGFSCGFGFRVYRFHFSYGRAIYHVAGASNTFSISMDINSFYHRATF